MNIQKLKHNRTFMTVLQGLFLLLILSTLFSVCVNLLVIGFSDDLQALNEKYADPQTVIKEGNEQKAAEGLAALNAASAELEQYRESAGPMKLLAVIMYAGFAMLFLLKALITRDNGHLNLYRYGIGCLLFTACGVIFLCADSLKVCGLAAYLHIAALAADHIFPSSGIIRSAI